MEYGTVEYWRDFRNQTAKEILVKMFEDKEQMIRDWKVYNSDTEQELDPQQHAAAMASSYARQLAITLEAIDRSYGTQN